MPPEGETFNPSEPYTHRLRRILEEYPDGSQVLREILQNSDDAKSTEQVFILDHNTYESSSLFKPNLEKYQGPALLAKNNTTFEERDFKSLLKLANSEKYDQFDKIGVMGVGFNSVYHITDSPSFITGDKYVILDPHKWYYDGGAKFSFMQENMAEECPDQFTPFRISCREPRDKPFKKPFKGTIFRYPLRNYTKSEICTKIYESKEVLKMFHTFYEKESINCLLFLKYIERIYFYEIKKGATELELLYAIQLDNADQVRHQRRLIAEKIVPMMKSLKSGDLSDNNQLETKSYVASFSRQRKDGPKETNKWLILNYLDDLLETEKYFQEKFRKNIGDYKFIPNVGLAVPLSNLRATGTLFCFLPLPISMPFLVSVHGYFAASTNRRSLWSAADSEDLVDGLARLKVQWNKYLFENVLPKAWVKLLCELPFEVSNIPSDDLYKFWPVIKEGVSGSMIPFCKDLLKNVIENLDIEDRVFKGPSSSNTIGKLSKSLTNSYDASSFKESEFHWLSLSSGYLSEKYNDDLLKTIGNIGFPVISNLFRIFEVLKDSKHENSLKHLSPAVIRTYLKRNFARWQDKIPREAILKLFEYILSDKNFDELEGFKMIPLADGTLGTLARSGNSCVYIGPDDNILNDQHNERNIFNNQLDKFIDKSIDYRLYKRLYDGAKSGWNLNIKILDERAVANMIRISLNSARNNSEEIPLSNHHREWINKLWDNLKYRGWDLTEFRDIHLIPTNNSKLRKLETPRNIFSSRTSRGSSIGSLVSIFERFGAVFVSDSFDTGRISKWDKMSPYIIKPDDIKSVLCSFQADTSYPRNLTYTLRNNEASALVDHLSIYLRQYYRPEPYLIEIIKHLPIFTEVDQTSPISLLPENRNWYLLPQEEENSYGKIIYPSNRGRFLSTSSKNLCYILEDIIKIPRLSAYNYWLQCVIPFLESQSPKDIDTITDKLFNRLPSIINNTLKDVLGRNSFVCAGTLRMSQQQQNPNNTSLVKPTDLFDPESAVAELFFDDERVFPAGKYGIPRNISSKNYLTILRTLGIKSALSSSDIVSRIDAIVRRSSNIDLIHIKAGKLFRYIDKNWDQLTNNGDASLKAILEKNWIPTINESGRRFLSKPQDCYYKVYKDLVCFVAPVLEHKHNVKSRKFLEYLNWHIYPDVETVLRQLDFCRDSVSRKEPPKELQSICNAIYNYMNEAFKAKDEIFDYMKQNLKNKPWILCENTFRSSDKVIMNLSSKFPGNDSLIVKLPIEYKSKFEMFKAMGIRDKIGVKDLILFIKDIVGSDNSKVLSENEINDVIQFLEQIVKVQKDAMSERRDPESLDGLLIPSTKNVLVDMKDIYFDDIEDRFDSEKKSEYTIAHPEVHPRIAKVLKIQTLTAKIYGHINYIEDIDCGVYEQYESLTTRIKNIVKDYSLSQLFKEFLQNADDAKATRFSVIVDQRKHNNSKKHLLSEEMEAWQGPAIWIYNDAEFSEDDFKALIKLGIGGKSRDEDEDDTRIGRFGIGFNCAFHVTDLPSFVSGKNIAFLDPHAKFLPTIGYPPRRRKGTIIDFTKEDFERSLPDQCHPYKALGCDFSKEGFKGTLFRLPLRTRDLAKQSEISKQEYEINYILKLFNDVQGNKEMLFLRNIESCSLYHMKDKDPQLIWQAQINNMSDNCRDIRKDEKPEVYQLDIETAINISKSQTKKISEIWLIRTGGHDKIKSEFKELREFSKKKQIKPRGGVASLLARSDKKSLDELKAEPFPNPPDPSEIRGELFSYLSLSKASYLGVHLNGNFSLSSARSSILQSDDDFLRSDCDDAKWNRYILLEVLPELHIKLLEEIVKLEEIRYENDNDKLNFNPHITNNFWPVNKNLTTDLFKNYGLNVIRKLGLSRDKKFFWTEANGGNFVSLSEARILDKEKARIANILINLKVPIQVVKLDKDKMEQLNKIVESRKPPSFPYTPISGKLVCEKLQLMKPFKSGENIIRNDVDSTHNSLFKLLTFILQDLREKNSFEQLNKLPLVPLSDGSIGEFGEQVYYVGKQKHLDLFPNAGPSKLISMDLLKEKELLEIFSSDEFSKATNVQKFDASAILALLKDELPNVNELPWKPKGQSIPNSSWLEDIWSILNKEAENIDFDELSKLPLLPIVQPTNMLIRPDTENPILYVKERTDFPLLSVLKKLKVRITNMVIPESAHEDLKNCVASWNSTNILNSLGKALLDNMENMEDTEQLFEDDELYMESMEQLFEESNLSTSDYKKFRAFIKEDLENLIEKGQNEEGFMRILKSLPIWQIHSCEDKFINATSGTLLPYKLPFFSFRKNTNFYKCSDESDFNTLIKLGVTFISELDYVKDHLLPDFIRFSTPSQEYIPFLQNVLSLGNEKIENYFRQNEMIPNRSLTEFVSANTLYDTNNPLFRSIFGDTDKTLPPELQNSSPACLEALGRIGLNRQIDCETYIICAREIESQIQQEIFPINVVKERAKNLVRYLYEHIDTLNFNSGQWDKILRIKFVPSERHLPVQFYQSQKETSGFETFEQLCSHKNKDICWTQRPLFDENIEPTTHFYKRRPGIGFPPTEDIIKHWFAIEEMSKGASWNRNYRKKLEGVIKDIYEIMNELSVDKNHENLIRVETNGPNKRIFLNGGDPFEENNWVAGSELVFDLQDEDSKEGMYGVKDFLKNYKDLLILAGAVELIPPPKPEPNPAIDRKVKLCNSLLDKLKGQSDRYHDVTFTFKVDKKIEKICANRYVLSAASEYFETMFNGGLSESTKNGKEVPINGTQPKIFRILLLCLYGESLENATKFVFGDFTSQESQKAFYLDLLKATDYYGVVDLIGEVEDIIINNDYIGVTNVCEILEWSKDSNATRLRDCCKEYIESNRRVIINKLSEHRDDENERSRISQMLDSLLSDN